MYIYTFTYTFIYGYMYTNVHLYISIERYMCRNDRDGGARGHSPGSHYIGWGTRGAGASAPTTRCQTRCHWSISLALILPAFVALACVVALSCSRSRSRWCSRSCATTLFLALAFPTLSSNIPFSLSLAHPHSHTYIETTRKHRRVWPHSHHAGGLSAR